MVHVYPFLEMGKTCKWSNPRIVLSIERNAFTNTSPSKGGKIAMVAIEDVRLALPDEIIFQAVQTSIDSAFQ